MDGKKKSPIIVRADGKIYWFKSLIPELLLMLCNISLVLLFLAGVFLSVIAIYGMILYGLGNQSFLNGIETWLGEVFPWLLKLSKM